MNEARRAGIAAELEGLAGRGLLRRRPVIDGRDGRCIRRRGPGGRQALLNWASNDYLGLIAEVRVANSARRMLRRHGPGAGAARLLAGGLACHRAFEEQVAGFLGTEDVLLTGAGYLANIAALPVLAAHRDDVLILDRLCHASLYDGARLAAGRLLRFTHQDLDELRRHLQAQASARRRIVVVESVYSMDGDESDLATLAALCHEHDAWLVVDEAHALGVLGPGGRGLCAAAGIRPDLLTATCSKALASQGGLLAGSAPLIELLVNRARAFIYATAPAPAVVGAASAALRLLAAEPALPERLQARAAGVRTALQAQGWQVPSGRTPIIPVLLGEEARALALSAALAERGHHAPAIRPPTVPAGACRLRLTVTLAHRDADIRKLISTMAELRGTSAAAPSALPDAASGHGVHEADEGHG